MGECRHNCRSPDDRLKIVFAVLVLVGLGLVFAALLFSIVGWDGAPVQAPRVATPLGYFTQDGVAHDHSSHSHSLAKPGSVGEVLQGRLEESLAEQKLTGHVGDPNEGVVLESNLGQETVRQGSTCSAGTPVRGYNLAAFHVEITLNRFLDHDPQGRMYALEENLTHVRREEARNRTSRATNAEPAVTQGL